MSDSRVNELDRWPDWLRAALQLREESVPSSLLIEPIVPVVDVLAARYSDIRWVIDTMVITGPVAQGNYVRVGPAAAVPQIVIEPGQYAYVWGASAIAVTNAATMAWKLVRSSPAGTIYLRGLALGANQTFGTDGANAATAIIAGQPLQIAPAQLSPPWVIPPGFELHIENAGGVAGGGSLRVDTLVAILPIGVRP